MRQSSRAAVTPQEACRAILLATAIEGLNSAGAREVAPPPRLAWAQECHNTLIETATA